VSNDPNAAQIVGYGEIVAPTSIGHLNYFTVLVFARNAEAVGWKQFKLVHAAAPEP
jgi:hypothetical protein